MAIALSDEHEALSRSVRGWLSTHCPSSVPRALLDADTEELQPIWKAMVAEGWLGLHLPEDVGGQGFSLFELAVVLEETGRAMVPGPFLSTVVTSTLMAEASPSSPLLRGLVDGSTPAAVSLGSACLDVVGGAEGEGITVAGTIRPLLSASTASAALVPARRTSGEVVWCLLDLAAPGGGTVVTALASLDPTRRVGQIEVDAAPVALDRQFASLTTDRVHQVAASLMAAEHAGGARWCLDTATDYAKVRVQFGRPIGQFQAIKHRLADMAIRIEQMTAVAWDAALALGTGDGDAAALAAATAGALALDGYADSAKECIQILGGIGFTWEHDAHLHLKRAMADRQLMGEPDTFRRQVAAGGRTGGTAGAGGRASRRGRGRAGRAGPGGGRAGRTRGATASPGHWSTPGWSCPTGRHRGAGEQGRWSSWSSTRSWPPPGSVDPTSASAPGPCHRSSRGGRPSNGNAGWTQP